MITILIVEEDSILNNGIKEISEDIHTTIVQGLAHGKNITSSVTKNIPLVYNKLTILYEVSLCSVDGIINLT